MLLSFMKKKISFMSILNNKGPSIDPCGTPDIISTQLLNDESILVRCFLLALKNLS